MLRRVGNVFRRPPIFTPIAKAIWAWLERRRLADLDTETVFTNIYRTNAWGDPDSISGAGSNKVQTQHLREALPALLRELCVGSLLDIPCGDFHWMRDVDLDGIQYIGADIVTELICNNQKLYTTDTVRFVQLNLLVDVLPQTEAVLCRDCLVHFSSSDVNLALRSVVQSGAKYLLTTTFVDRTFNAEIATGQWRPINLEQPPFSLPPPIRVLNEMCTEADGSFSDKSLGVWRVEDLRLWLTRCAERVMG